MSTKQSYGMCLKKVWGSFLPLSFFKRCSSNSDNYLIIWQAYTQQLPSCRTMTWYGPSSTSLFVSTSLRPRHRNSVATSTTWLGCATGQVAPWPTPNMPPFARKKGFATSTWKQWRGQRFLTDCGKRSSCRGTCNRQWNRSTPTSSFGQVTTLEF